MPNFYTDVIAKHPLYNSINAVTDVNLLWPPFLVAVNNIIGALSTPERSFHIGETYRSRLRQQYLFRKGLTRLRNVGVHHYGLAVDLLMIVDKKYDPVGEHYSVLRPLCVSNGVVWGGDWGEPDRPHSFRDWDHIQAVTIGDQERLFAGTWYPDNRYVPSVVG